MINWNITFLSSVATAQVERAHLSEPVSVEKARLNAAQSFNLKFCKHCGHVIAITCFAQNPCASIGLLGGNSCSAWLSTNPSGSHSDLPIALSVLEMQSGHQLGR